jgi:hypothetical protein
VVGEKTWIIGAAIVLAAAVIGGVLIFLRQEQRDTELTERCRREYAERTKPNTNPDSLTFGLPDPMKPELFVAMFPECEGHL